MQNELNKEDAIYFAPVLYLNDVSEAIIFYTKAFDAQELRRWSNEDGSMHVAEMRIGSALFHLHEEVSGKKELGPKTLQGTTVVIGLFVNDPVALVTKAVAAGSELTSAVQDYDYGYLQGNICDPFGHHWMIEKKI